MLFFNTKTKPTLYLLILYLLIPVVFFTLLTFSYQAYSAPQTTGYAPLMPNRFWPNTTSILSTGNLIQQNTSVNNPDVFCESQGSGYRLFSVSEFSAKYYSLNPWHAYSNIGVTPGHWNSYVGYDIQNSRKSNSSLSRSVSGAIYDEWGDLSKYAKGWPSSGSWFWTTEPSYYTNNPPTLGRIAVNISTQAVQANHASVASASFYVACVRDLVPTPSTPNPGKS